MKKITISCMAILMACSLNAQSDKGNFAERAPQLREDLSTHAQKTNALWDIQKSIDITTASGGSLGNAGVVFMNNQFWVSKWASDTIMRFDATGNLIDKFVVAGVSQVRALSTNGYNIFAANSTNKIYNINPNTKTLNGAITLKSNVTARYCAFDPTLDNGNGGFWVGNFGTDIESVSMTGKLLSTISIASVGKTGIYGAAVDFHTAGGPYLWVFDQGGANTSDLVQLNLPSGTPTGVEHDVFLDLSNLYSSVSSLAGGVFITHGVENGKASLVCLAQGSPANVIMSYELGNTSIGLNEIEKNNIKVYPNPSQDYITISLTEKAQNTTFVLTDLMGRVVMEGLLDANVNTIDLTTISTGNYVLEILINNQKITQESILKINQ